MSDPTLDWFTRLYGEAPGLIALSHHDGSRFRGNAGTFTTPEDAAAHVSRLNVTGGQGVYHRVTTLAAAPEVGQRGGGEHGLALPGLWADVDFGSVGHKHDPTQHHDRPLPPDAAAAWRMVTESGLPQPSLWVHTGGGLYPWWLFDQALILDENTRPMAAQLSTRWQEILQISAHAHGWDYGAGVGDLARVLRVPGTTNRKTDEPRPCRVVQDDGIAYTLDELLQATLDAPKPQPPPMITPAPRPARQRHIELVPGHQSPLDTLDEHVTFDDILTGAGWTQHRGSHSPSIKQCWSRPGGPDNPCSAHTLREQPNVLVCFSEAAGLPTGGGHRLTRARVFAHLHHGGDEQAAVRDIATTIRGGTSTPAAQDLPLPRSTVPQAPITRGDLYRLEQDQVAHDHHGAQLQPPLDDEPPAPPTFEFHTIAELRARVRSRGRRRWLLRGLWPEGDYGIFGAEKKAQKTWAAVDLAVAVTSATPWLGLIETDAPGPVLMFVGEGGEGNTLRRIDAAAEERNLDADTLAIHVCARVPHLSNTAHIQLLEQQVATIRPALVIIDPFYLAARGGELGDLFRQGAMLEDVQRACQAHQAALLIVHHFNRSQGSGAGRLSGAGPAEWGRVLITAEKKSSRTDPETRATDVITHLEAVGGEIPDQAIRVHRKVWADDPDDLESPLHTTTHAHWATDDETNDETQGTDTDSREKASPASRKLLEALDAIGRPATSSELVDRIVQLHGHGLTRETTSRELNKLFTAGILDYAEEKTAGNRWPTKTWCRTLPEVAS